MPRVRYGLASRTPWEISDHPDWARKLYVASRIAGLTQAQVAARIGKSRSYVVVVETGRARQAERSVENALDARLPNRKTALEARRVSVAAYAEAQIAASTTRNLAAVLAGDSADAARASIRAKSVAWEQTRAEGRDHVDPVGLAVPARPE